MSENKNLAPFWQSFQKKKHQSQRYSTQVRDKSTAKATNTKILFSVYLSLRASTLELSNWGALHRSQTMPRMNMQWQVRASKYRAVTVHWMTQRAALAKRHYVSCDIWLTNQVAGATFRLMHIHEGVSMIGALPMSLRFHFLVNACSTLVHWYCAHTLYTQTHTHTHILSNRVVQVCALSWIFSSWECSVQQATNSTAVGR